MMELELDIDQSHLPRVQEVCQCFAVLEDGAFAHNLQEQEIEQYYNSNVQKNQLFQNDIRIAKRLQDEEEERMSQATLQLEEQDSEYARRIQEEIQRCAEETRRREEEDQEMAKRLQEEEIDCSHHGSTGDVPLIEERPRVPDQPHPRQPVHASPSPSPRPSPTPSLSPDSSPSEEETPFPPTSRVLSPVSSTDSDCEEPPVPRLSHVPQNNSAPQQAARQSDALRLIRNLLRESLGPAYNFDDEVFLRSPSMPAYRLPKRLNTAPSGHQRLDYPTQGGGNHSSHSNVAAGEREGEGRDESVIGSRRNRSRDERSRSNSYHGDVRWQEGRVEGHHRNEVRVQDRVYSWTYREDEGSRQRHVHFQDERRRKNSYHGDSRRETATGSYQNNLEDRGVAARRSCRGDFRQVRGSGSRSNHDEHMSGEDTGHRLSQVLQRNVSTRRSYHGDFRDRRRDSNRDDRRVYSEESTQSEHRVNYLENLTIQEDRDYRNTRPSQNHSAEHHGDRTEWEGVGRGNRQGREEGGAGGDHCGDRRVKRSASEHWWAYKEPESSLQEEGGRRDERRWREGGRREERLQREGVRCSVSLTSSLPPPRAGHRGAGVAPRRDGACLELGELEQVLRDEELARMLQEEEVEERRPLGKGPPFSRGPQKSNPREDFKAAQVAQDEEIARFMQRQERKAQRRSCDLGQGSRQEHREPGDAHERRSTRERKVEVPQMPRERLDSEGLNSPGEDLSPDCQPPSPSCTTSQPQAMRNIAEELDPTFQAKRRDSNPAGQASSGLSTSPSSHSGLHDYTQEPTFVPPTKRQSDKLGRPKAKEKKESCKQQ